MGQAVLSRPMVVAVKAATTASPYLIFALDTEMFAIGTLRVKTVVEYATLIEIPMEPTYIRGVIRQRGDEIPVIDLSARFGGRPTAAGKLTRIVIVEVQQQDEQTSRHDIGILVDAVAEAPGSPGSQIELAPNDGAAIGGDFIFGTGKVDGKSMLIIDSKELLSPALIRRLKRSERTLELTAPPLLH
ncbi:MAG: purine-binding chemotaxis protein CheW [Proteobacteria bacterium]|nr:purine-binding chemotaxis protein CheW [Pseudomonadota bacterium]